MAQQIGEIKREKRPGGTFRYCIQVWIHDARGLRQRRKLYSGPGEDGIWGPIGKSRQRAMVALGVLRGHIAAGKTVEQAVELMSPNQADSSVHARWDEWLRARELERSTSPIGDKRLKELSRFIPRGYLAFFDRTSVLDLTSAMLVRWTTELSRRWPIYLGPGRSPEPTAEQRAAGVVGFHKPKMRHHIVNDFLTFDAWLRTNGYRPEDRPLMKPKLPALDGTRQAVPTEPVLAAYLAAIPEDRRGIFLARSYDGLRIEEARRLHVRNYNWKTQELELFREDTKTDAGVRNYLVDPELAAWLEKSIPPAERMNRNRALFINPGCFKPAAVARAKVRNPNRPITGRWTPTAERIVHERACRAIGIEGQFPPNAMGRHAAATHMLLRTKTRSGSHDIEAVRKKLGHTDRATTDTYIDNRQVDVSLTRRVLPIRDAGEGESGT